MTLEAKIDELIQVNKDILKALQSGAAVAAPAAVKTETKTTKTETKTPASAPAPAPAAPGVEWKTVLAKITDLNKSTKEGHGRAGVLKVISHFGLTPKSESNPNGATVPTLETLGQNAEILAFVESLLKGDSGAAGDDLGI